MDEEHISWRCKVDHHLRALVERTQDDVDAASRPVQVLIRVAEESDFVTLHVPGLQLGSIAGNIATATVNIKDISMVASSLSILFMELSGSYSPGVDQATGDMEIDQDKQ